MTRPTFAMLRQQYVDWYFVPLARELLRIEAGYQAIVLAFEDWREYRDDGVRVHVLPFEEASPVWPPDDLEDRLDTGWGASRRTRVNGDRVREAHWALYGDAWTRHHHEHVYAFAPYCNDPGSPRREGVAPYAVVRRQGAPGAEVEIVGELWRPHLEDRLDRVPRTTLEPDELLHQLAAAHVAGTLSPAERAIIERAPAERARLVAVAHRWLDAVDAWRAEGCGPPGPRLLELRGEVGRELDRARKMRGGIGG